jgi:Protein of unknown function (DUF664)
VLHAVPLEQPGGHVEDAGPVAGGVGPLPPAGLVVVFLVGWFLAVLGGFLVLLGCFLAVLGGWLALLGGWLAGLVLVSLGRAWPGLVGLLLAGFVSAWLGRAWLGWGWSLVAGLVLGRLVLAGVLFGWPWLVGRMVDSVVGPGIGGVAVVGRPGAGHAVFVPVPVLVRAGSVLPGPGWPVLGRVGLRRAALGGAGRPGGCARHVDRGCTSVSLHDAATLVRFLRVATRSRTDRPLRVRCVAADHGGIARSGEPSGGVAERSVSVGVRTVWEDVSCGSTHGFGHGGRPTVVSGADLLVDGFGRIREVVHEVVDGLTPDQLAYRVDGKSNSIAWLVWHLTRVQDDHLADAFDGEQVWTEAGWADRFALPLDRLDTGYGHKFDEVAAVRADADLLAGYHDAVHARTVELVRPLTVEDLDRVVDERWTPAVTLAVRLVSVVSDDLQHAGQAAFLKGVISAS